MGGDTTKDYLLVTESSVGVSIGDILPFKLVLKMMDGLVTKARTVTQEIRIQFQTF